MNELLIDKVRGLSWFHAIDFGDFASQGRFRPGTPQNITLYGVFEFLKKLEVEGARLLDIGAYDGIVAFGAKKLGATVVAVDTFDHETFRLARELLGFNESSVEYIPNVQIMDLLEKFEFSSFDVICCAGVIYHMLNPMEAFTVNRKLLKVGGYLIMESPYDARNDDAVLTFNGVEQIVNEPYTYFVPTLKALKGMANLSGFEVVATRVLTSPKRVTLLLRAVNRGYLIEHNNTPPFIVQMLKRDTCDNSFRFRDLKEIGAAWRDSVSNGILELREIDPATEKVNFPFHPQIHKPAYGSTRFETADGNTLKL